MFFIALKPRAKEIHAAYFADRMMHHALISPLDVRFEPVSVPDGYSNRKGKGIYKAVKRSQFFMQSTRDGYGQANNLQPDVRNFFQIINRCLFIPFVIRSYKMKKIFFLGCILLLGQVEAVQTCNDAILATTPDSYFTNESANEVKDVRTGLIWQRCSLGLSGDDCMTGSAGTYDWQQALLAAETERSNTALDWRLPNVKELLSITEEKCSSPAINLEFFPNTPSSNYWSASPYAYYSFDAWYVYFYYGSSGYGDKGNYRYVRLVRGGQ